MEFTETKIAGVVVIDIKRIEDDRGFFGRSWCIDELTKAGLDPTLKQVNIGFSPKAGTMRGMHLQTAPHAEIKIVRCTLGAVYDVALDLRPESPTFRQWYGLELTAENRRSLYIPEGCAHGYLTLTEDSEIYYFTSKAYAPDHATGYRYDDPAFGIEWPHSIEVISDADKGWPDFEA